MPRYGGRACARTRAGTRRSAGTPIRLHAACTLAVVCLAAAACGKKGPPLAPLHLVPAAVSDLTARRVEDQVVLRFALPTRNANGPGPIALDRVEIYAVTVAPGAPTVPDRDLLTEEHLVGAIEVRPPPVEGAAPAEAAAEETRPAPGDTVTFVEQLTASEITPAVAATDTIVEPAAAPSGAAPVSPPSSVPLESDKTDAGALPIRTGLQPPLPGVAVPATGSTAAEPARIYVIRGATRGGRPGAASPRLQVSLVDPPPPPTGVAARYTEKAVVLDWLPAVAEVGAVIPAFNVYRDDATLEPVNATPLTSAVFEQPIVKFGIEQCFRVRTVWRAGNVPIEGDASLPVCITPRDTFAPAAPAGLSLVAADGAINLRWNANAEPDLAGYLVLRGEAPDDTLRALTPAPIRETSYRDGSVTPGVRYVYAIVAVDTATPPNVSAQSGREAETAR